MKTKVTQQQLFEARLEYYDPKYSSSDERLRAALETLSIPEPLPTLPTLRPIAEMSEKPPEKAVRFFCYPMSDSRWSVLSDAKCEEDTHFIDILLPVESAEGKMRAEFEKGMQERGHILRRKEETYDEPIHHFAWVGFKLAKSATQP